MTSSHSLIASDRIEGSAVVKPATGERVGTIQRLMIDKLSGNVAYAVLTFGGFLGFGEKHFPLPWGALKYHSEVGKSMKSTLRKNNFEPLLNMSGVKSTIGVIDQAGRTSSLLPSLWLLGSGFLAGVTKNVIKCVASTRSP